MMTKLKVETALTMRALRLAAVGHHLEAQASNWCLTDHDLRVPVAGVENLRKNLFMYWYTGIITFKTLNQK